MNKADMNYIEILKKKVDDLDAINKELMEEMKKNEADWRHVYINSTEFRDEKIEDLKKEIKELKDLSAELESECILKDMRITELKKEIDAKDSLITSYKVAGAKLFHENERLKKRIEELEKIEG